MIANADGFLGLTRTVASNNNERNEKSPLILQLKLGILLPASASCDTTFLFLI